MNLLGYVMFMFITVFVLIGIIFKKTDPTLNAPVIVNINPNIHEIIPGLYLTSAKHATDYDSLRALGVRQILTIGSELKRHGEPYFKVLHIKIPDIPTANIKKYFNLSYDFINRAPTLVHCAMGISRSATLVCAYLIRKQEMKADKAIKFVKSKRWCVNPNPGFVEQLEKYEKEILQEESNTEEPETGETDT